MREKGLGGTRPSLAVNIPGKRIFPMIENNPSDCGYYMYSQVVAEHTRIVTTSVSLLQYLHSFNIRPLVSMICKSSAFSCQVQKAVLSFDSRPDRQLITYM